MIYFFYIFLNYIKLVFSALFFCLGLFVLFDYMQKVTPPSYFGIYTFDLKVLAQYYFFQMPFQVLQFLPLVSLLGSAVLLSVMTFRNENIVLRSFGVGPYKLLPPLVLAGSMLVLFSVILSEFLVPHSVEKLKNINEVVLKKTTNSLSKKYFWIKNENKILKFQGYDQKKGKLLNIELLEFSSDFKLLRTIFADSATLTSKSNLWRLDKVKLINLKNESSILSEKNLPQSFVSFLSFNFNMLNYGTDSLDKISLNKLGEILALKKEYSLNALNHRVAWHAKLSYQIMIFLFSIIGIKFAFEFSRVRTWASNFIFVIVIAFGYWIAITFGKSVSVSGSVDPIWVSWGSVFFVFCLIMYQVITSERKIKN